MEKYICAICGYVYDPEVGDPDNGVEPGTAWEDVPEDWVCPLCGVDKENFAAEQGQGLITDDQDPKDSEKVSLSFVFLDC